MHVNEENLEESIIMTITKTELVAFEDVASEDNLQISGRTKCFEKSRPFPSRIRSTLIFRESKNKANVKYSTKAKLNVEETVLNEVNRAVAVEEDWGTEDMFDLTPKFSYK